MSRKPCGCGKAQAEAVNAAEQTAKPEIVPLPPEVRERHRANRPADSRDLLPADLAATLVPLPDGAEPDTES